MQQTILALDFGASSGRAVVGRYQDGKMQLEEVYRFSNYPIENEKGFYWDFKELSKQLVIGIQKATEKYAIDSLGIDTWGVDFGLLDDSGNLIENPRSYRDTRTKGMLEVAEKKMDTKDIYFQTGNQLMEINSLFQLLAIQKQEPDLLKKTKTILFISDLMNYFLTGEKKVERSIASTSQMIHPEKKIWNKTVLEAFDLKEEMFPPLVDSGSFLGKTKTSLGIPSIDVYNVCQHDTASAVVSVPSQNDFLFISCGTWSLIGTELTEPLMNEKAFQYNLTNELGYKNTVDFLKNCTGLWIIQELRRNFDELNRKYSFAEIAEMAQKACAFQCFIDTDDPIFSVPGNMIDRIQEYAKKTKQTVPTTDGELARCVYESLAMKYAYTLLEISDVTKREFSVVNIVGGGANAKILCQMVAEATNLPVEAGPVEATALGNIVVQLIAKGVFKDIQEARLWIKKEFPIKKYSPTSEHLKWEKSFTMYQKVLKESQKKGV